MGNIAVITTEAKEIGIYLHWNGGRDSVEAFLLYCKLQGYRFPEADNYGWARLTQVIGNYFGGELSIGIDRYEHLDYNNIDNGTYIIKDWKIVDRIHLPYNEFEEQGDNPLIDMLLEIDENMPKDDRLFSKYSVDEVRNMVENIHNKDTILENMCKTIVDYIE